MPAKKPTKLKELKGTVRKSRQHRNEPRPAPEVPEPPAWMRGEALEEWERVTAELEPLGYLSQLDRGVLTAYCLLWARLCSAANGEGEPIKAAEVAQFRACASSLGLDPVSRSRIEAPQPKKKHSPWAAI